MPDFEKIIYETRDRIAVVTINRPERMNAIDPQTSAELNSAMTSFRDDDALWVAILTGAGERAFSAGNDLVAMSQAQQSGQAAMAAAYLRAPFGGITRNFVCHKPIIAAINGYCLAGGLEIALACDIRVAAEHAQFGLPEVTRAIIPGAGGTQRLPRTIPLGLALELMLTGGRFDAAWALRNGLVNHVVPADQVMPKAIEIAQAICENGPLAVRLVKEAVYAGLNLPLDEGFKFENEQSRKVLASEDAREGPLAFAQKRKPNYKGA
ncbi:MAG: enoyl-CoA hydratase/isomerase family protein [Chloroflexota bacterium]|nr:enoyl-CoA hydratase/isomerase family protein [Chloroflexota bacterium]